MTQAEQDFQTSHRSLLFALGIEAYHDRLIASTLAQRQRVEYLDGIAYADGRDRGAKPHRSRSPDIAYEPRQKYAFDRGFEHGQSDRLAA